MLFQSNEKEYIQLMKKFVKWSLILAVILIILLLWALYESPYRCARAAEMYPILQAWCELK